jgi:hypothetical protein
MNAIHNQPRFGGKGNGRPMRKPANKPGANLPFGKRPPKVGGKSYL